jgi:dTDP-4-dehydrorhamnose reductase
LLRLARLNAELEVVSDQIGSPTSARELALATTQILQSPRLQPETLGTYHLSAAGHTSRFDFARSIVEAARQHSGTAEGWAHIKPTTTANYPRPAARPLNAATSKEKIRRLLGITMTRWDQQLAECLFSMGRKMLPENKQA